MSGILLRTMEVRSGSDLLETLNDLNIQTGQLSVNAISAWFDTDSENNKHLLNWLCNLNKCNILSAVEKQENDEILKSNCFVGMEDCEKELNDVLIQYPALINMDENLLDIQLLESEIEGLLETESKQDLLISQAKQVGEEFSKDIAKLTTEKISTSVAKDKGFELCTQLSTDLDNLNTKLHTFLARLQDSLYNFQHAPISSFFSNIDMIPYFDCSDIIASSIDIYIKENDEDTSQNLSLVSSFLNSDTRVDADEEQLLKLKERIYKSTLSYLHKQIDEKCRMAELEFLKTYTTSFNLNASMSLENSLDGSVEVNNKLDLMNLQLENYVNKISFKHIRGPEINLIKDKVAWNEKKLAKVLSVKEALLKTLRFQNIMWLMYKTEQEAIVGTDVLFRDVSNYIIEDLKECEVRTNKMLEKIQACTKLDTTNTKNRFVECIAGILSNETTACSSLTDAVHAMNTFIMKRNFLLKQLHTGGFNRFVSIYKERSANNAVMVDYLKSGPISRITAVPHPLLHLIMEIDNLLTLQKQKLMETIDTQKNVQTKLDKNKWLRYRRQLWIHFLRDPKKMLMYINEIQLNIKQISKMEP